MKFQEVIPISRIDAKKLLKSGDPEIIGEALLRLTFYDKDLIWIQNKCIKFLEYPNKAVKEMAIKCLGHLVRIHGQLGNYELISILNELTKDADISGIVEDTLDDIKTFVPDSNYFC